MDPDLQRHIIDIKTSIAGLESNVDNIKDGLAQHVARDEIKFKDLYGRHEAHDAFQHRVKGTAKGVGLLGAAGTGVLAFWQQIVEAFSK